MSDATTNKMKKLLQQIVQEEGLIDDGTAGAVLVVAQRNGSVKRKYFVREPSGENLPFVIFSLDTVKSSLVHQVVSKGENEQQDDETPGVPVKGPTGVN